MGREGVGRSKNLHQTGKNTAYRWRKAILENGLLLCQLLLELLLIVFGGLGLHHSLETRINAEVRRMDRKDVPLQFPFPHSAQCCSIYSLDLPDSALLRVT